MIPTMATSRLRLRPLTPNDAADLFPLFQDEETLKFWPNLPHQQQAETKQMLVDLLKPERSCWWAVCLRDEETAVGFVGFLGNNGVPGMGYILQRDLWGKGYTTEAMRVAIDYGFHTLHYDRVELWIHEGNVASQRVADKLGFDKKGLLRSKFPGRERAHDMVVYGLRAEEWVDTAVPQKRSHRFYDLQPVLPVANISEAVEFYRDKLGFSVDFVYGDPPDHAAVSRGEWTTNCARLQFTLAAAGTTIQPVGWLYFNVGSGIDSLFLTFTGKGVTAVQAPTNQPWGMREFIIEDNNGYQLRFGTQI